MGTWGTGPFDNDDAGDMIAKFVRPVKLVEHKNNQFRYNEARAAVQFLLLSHGTDILGGPGLLSAVCALARIRSDTEWLSSYKTPDVLAHNLEVEIYAVVEKMRSCKGCSRSDVREAEAIGFEATMLPVPPTGRRRELNRSVARRPRRSK